MAKFEALEVAVELVGAMRPIVEQVRRQDRDLAEQMRRATTSVPSNIAEGSRRQGRDRNHHFSIAAGSADEARVQLRIALAWGYVEQVSVGPALALVDRVLAMLWRAVHPRA